MPYKIISVDFSGYQLNYAVEVSVRVGTKHTTTGDEPVFKTKIIHCSVSKDTIPNNLELAKKKLLQIAKDKYTAQVNDDLRFEKFKNIILED